METIQLDPFLILCANLHMIEGHKCEKQNSVLIEKNAGKNFFLSVGVKGWKLKTTSDSKDERVRWKVFRQLTCSCTAVLTFRKKSASESRSVCLALYDPMEIPHGIHRVHGILQARILEWVAFPFSRGSSQPGDWTHVSRIAGGFFTSWATREAPKFRGAR